MAMTGNFNGPGPYVVDIAPVSGARFQPYSVRAYGAKEDGRVAYDAGLANGSNLVNSSTIGFTQDDVGKLFLLMPGTENRQFNKFGTILQVNSSTQAVVSVTGGASQGSGCTLFVASDDTNAFNAAVSAASAGNGGGVFVSAICGIRGSFTIPNGVWLEGDGSITPPNGGGNVYYRGSCLVRMDAVTGSSFLTLGSAHASNNRAASAFGLTIEGADMAGSVAMGGYGGLLQQCCMLGGAVNTAPSATLLNNYIVGSVGSYSTGVLRIGGDVKCIGNQIYAVGAGNPVVQMDGNGSEFIGNHLYAGSSTYGARTAGIRITTAGSRGGNNIIANNVIDTPMGPAILLDVSGSSVLSNVQVHSNNVYQNDSVPANTHPFIKLSVGASAKMMGCSVQGNVGRSSWNVATNGTWTHMVDHSAVAGSVVGVSIKNNTCTDVVGNIYSGGTTPTGVITGGNVIVKTDNTTVVSD